jgi:hypothetical protein
MRMPAWQQQKVVHVLYVRTSNYVLFLAREKRTRRERRKEKDPAATGSRQMMNTVREFGIPNGRYPASCAYVRRQEIWMRNSDGSHPQNL